MSKVYKSAMGKKIDMDRIRLANEQTIAIGNMATNARGDELGKGGKIVKSRAQLMQDYHKLNTPTAIEEDAKPAPKPAEVKAPIATDVETKLVKTKEASAKFVKPSTKDSGLDEEDLTL